MSTSTAEREEEKDWNDLIDEEMETRRNDEEMIEQKLDVTLNYNKAIRTEKESMKKTRKRVATRR